MNKKVVIASLLHDIGKLLQRTNGEKIYHGQVGKNYLASLGFDKEILDAVYCHHKKKLNTTVNLSNELLTYLVYEADNLSSEHDRKDNVNDDIDEKWINNAPLKTVFSYLNGVSKKEYAYPARDLNPNKKIIYPVEQNDIFASQDKYQSLKKIIDDNLNKDISPNSLLELLESTMTYVTSSTNAEENLDISLFDHSKTTAAIASCLYNFLSENNISNYRERLVTNPNRDEKYYLLVSGDISGIQDFIYTISSKGALKSLRARSFYLEVMLEHIVDEILSELNLFRCNLLYTGGGHFYMLLPNTQKTKDVLKKAQEKINDWFIDEFGSALFIAMAEVEASSNDLKDTKNIFKKVSRKLSKKKLSRYNKNQLKKLIKPYKNVSSRECVICRTSSKSVVEKDFIDSKLEICDKCFNLLKLGENLVKEDIKFVICSEPTELSIEMPSVNEKKKYLSFVTSKNFETTDGDRVYVLNNRCTGDTLATKLFAGNYTYKIENKTADFKELLSENKGIKRLAVLRCDVDNLGQTFVCGFNEADKTLCDKNESSEQKTYSTLSRITSLSRQLSLFFKFYINNVCKSDINGEANIEMKNFSLDGTDEQGKQKRISIVYSGGDDVFVVGAWLDVLNFAFDLRKAFKKYTCDKLTFSGGLGFFSAGYPISQMASQVGELEDIAKKYDNSSKDSLSLFGKTNDRCDTYHWDEFQSKVYEKICCLMKCCYFDEQNPEENKIFLSTAMCYKFKQLITVTERQDEKINVARLAYTLARMKPIDKELNENETLKQRWDTFKENIYNWCNEDRKSLLTALDLIIYLNRKEVENE